MLAAATGKSRRTVYRALATLQAYGLANDGGNGWQRGPVELAEVAAALDCEQAAQRRRWEHERQREAWRGIVTGERRPPARGQAEAYVEAQAFGAVLGDDWRTA
jgi:hypothetical protein